MRLPVVAAAVALVALPLAPSLADEPVAMTIVIKDHKFDPEKLQVPAGKVIELTVDNQDATPEEFESNLLKVEKVIPGKSKGKVRLGPVEAGTYEFVGEFFQATAHGVIVAE
jgi:hypothetical protein